MNKYNPNIHHRRSIRLKGYDYSQAGLYFVTICIKNRECLFGEIIDGKMQLNDAGRMVEKWYYELENKYTDMKCNEMIVMPNHFHCIIHNVGADLRVSPNTDPNTVEGEHIGSPQPKSPQSGSPQSGTQLSTIIQWFKTMTTNEYIRGVKTNGWQPFDGKLWQRDYWEHIIRNETSFNNIMNYIIENPLKWDADKLNLKNPISDR